MLLVLQQVDAEMVTTSCCIRTGIVYTTLEAPMEKTQGTVIAGRCTMVSFQGLKAGTVESISDISSSALRSTSLSKLVASLGAFSSGTLLSKIFSSSLGCFFTYLKTLPEVALKIVGVL
jgi:hypothetical protein